MALIARLSDSSDPSRALTFVAERAGGPAGPAFGSSRRRPTSPITAETAEVAFAVADDFQGKGLGTALLERLAVAAASRGLPPLPGDDARAQHADARRVSRLGLRDSIEIRGRLCRRAVVARSVGGRRRGRGRTEPAGDGRVAPPAVAPRGASPSSAPRAIPRTSAGACSTRSWRPASADPIYAVNPHAAEVAGMKTYSVGPGASAGVDLAVIAVPAAAVPGVVDDCAAAGIQVARRHPRRFCRSRC